MDDDFDANAPTLDMNSGGLLAGSSCHDWGSRVEDTGLIPAAAPPLPAPAIAPPSISQAHDPIPPLARDDSIDLLDLLADPSGENQSSSTHCVPPPTAMPPSSASSGCTPLEATTSVSETCFPAAEQSSALPTVSLAIPPLKRSTTQALDLEFAECHPPVSCSVEEDSDMACVAMMVSTNVATAPDIKVGSAPVSVGRDEGATVVLDDPRVSSEQFVVRRLPLKTSSDGVPSPWQYELEDKSRNGTLVSKKLIKCASVWLRNQDLVEVLPSSKVGRAAAISFLFQEPQSATVESGLEKPTKQRRLEASGFASEAAGDKAIARMFEGATCSICQEVLHRAASIQPCLHTFCSACLGVWLKKPSGAVCPLCRKVATGVSRNTAFDGLVEGMLAAHPHMRRSPEALEDSDANDALHNAEYDLARLRVVPGVLAPPGSGDTASEEDSSDSDQEMAEGAAAIPADGGPPCFHCAAPSWQPLEDVAASLNADVGLASALAHDAFARNVFEREIFEEWLASRPGAPGLAASIAAMLSEPNPEGVQPVRVQLSRPAAPTATDLPVSTWGGIRACRTCACDVLRALIYALRERAPEAELPARARGRSNCWYGRGCRTQSNRQTHAERLNHICEQVRFH